MRRTQPPEDREHTGPNDNEEEQDQKSHGPVRSILRTPKIRPIASIGRGEEVVLQDNQDEEPAYDLATEERFVEMRRLTR